jgi:GAF domain-containing protein
VDERKKNAFLQSSSSTEGKLLIGQGIRIEPDRLNLIHRVIESNRPYIASDDDHTKFIRDENFPLTRSRMILPLTVRGDIIGMLDMHADQTHVFNTQDAETLQTLADLVAISIDNVRLLDGTKNLIRQLEANTSTQTKETWAKFTSRHKPAYQYTPAGVRPLFASNKKESEDGLLVPLMLHGQKIGKITLKRKGVAAAWSNRERVLVEKVATQVALAIENSRLVDETQKRALRDQVIANISARVRETLEVESVLRTAATEFRKVFDLKEAEISIGSSVQTGVSPVKKSAS